MFKNRLFRIQFFALIIGVVLMIVKYGAYLLTNSNTILTDALESIVNIVAALFALYSIVLAAKPEDEDHPYGHGKIAFLSAGLEGFLIICAGLIILGKSIFTLFYPHEISQLEIGAFLIIVSGFINFVVGHYLEKEGEQSRSLILIADGKHLKTDAYTSLGILVGIVVIYVTHKLWLDSTIAILISLYIIYSGGQLIRKSLKGIMDEADETLIVSLLEYINQHRKDTWIDIHNMRIIQYGSKLHVDCHMTLPWYYSLEKAHDEADELDKSISQLHGEKVEFFIHLDPCIEAQCKICCYAECTKRRHPFEKKIEWTMDNITKNRKHGLQNDFNKNHQ